MPIIQVNNLGKRFRDFDAVKDVSFEVEEGEVFGFLGPNGAGKTTTINMLCTLLRPTSGGATVAGSDIIKQKNAVRRSIGLVFQETTLDDHLTAEQNILFHALAYGVSSDVRKRRTKELLTLMGLWDRRKDKIRTYSGGMKRRLEIARGLVHLPQVLFLDEPTLGLDPQTRNRIWEYILGLREKEGLTIFLTTHYMDEAENSDRIAVIDDGKIVAMDTPTALKSQVSGDTVTISSDNNDLVEKELKEKYSLTPVNTNGTVSVRVTNGEEFVPQFVQGFGGTLRTIGLRRPTLEDVFLHVTGRHIRDEKVDEQTLMRQAMRARHR